MRRELVRPSGRVGSRLVAPLPLTAAGDASMALRLYPSEPDVGDDLALFLCRHGCFAEVAKDGTVIVELPHVLHQEQARMNRSLHPSLAGSSRRRVRSTSSTRIPAIHLEFLPGPTSRPRRQRLSPRERRRNGRQLRLTVGGAARPDSTVRADPVGNGGAVISKERRHFLLRQLQTCSLVAVTPRTASDQGVWQRPQGHSIDRWTRPSRYRPGSGFQLEQPSDAGAEERKEKAALAAALSSDGWIGHDLRNADLHLTAKSGVSIRTPIAEVGTVAAVEEVATVGAEKTVVVAAAPDAVVAPVAADEISVAVPEEAVTASATTNGVLLPRRRRRCSPRRRPRSCRCRRRHR